MRSPISLQLGELVARRQADAAVAERVRPQDPPATAAATPAAASRRPVRGEPADAEQGRERDRGRGGRERLAADPRRADDAPARRSSRARRARRRAAPGSPAAPAPRESGDRGGDRRRDQRVRGELGVGVEAEVARGPDPGGLRGLERLGEVAARAGVGERRGGRRQQRPGRRSSAARARASTPARTQRPRARSPTRPRRRTRRDRDGPATAGASQTSPPALSTPTRAAATSSAQRPPRAGRAAGGRIASATNPATSAAATTSLTPPQR